LFEFSFDGWSSIVSALVISKKTTRKNPLGWLLKTPLSRGGAVQNFFGTSFSFSCLLLFL